MSDSRSLAHGVFDANRPPSLALADDCVHCGFCLPACPTYALWGQEMDSPRGRIHLIKLGLHGEVALDDTFRRHMDRCLGCMACVSACPSGVKYEPLLEATRAQIERRLPRSFVDRAFRRALYAVVEHRLLLRAAVAFGWLYRRLGLRRLADKIGLLRRLPARLAAAEALLPEVALADVVGSMPAHTNASGPARLRVGLIEGCVQAVLFREVNLATARVLAAEGCDVVVPRAPCCGALAVHAGRDARARALAKGVIAAFEAAKVDCVVVNAAGCGSALKHYGELLGDDPAWQERAQRFAAKVRDVTELVCELTEGGKGRAPRHPIPARVAYHDACHLAHAQGIRAAPRQILAAIPGIELIEVPDGDMCCGSAGTYNLTEPAAAEALGQRKAEHIRAAAPDIVAAANPGCTMQIQRYLTAAETQPGAAQPPCLIPVVHPIQLVDRSIRSIRSIRSTNSSD